jgi:recombination protein RecR
MSGLPKTLQVLIEELGNLPGVGPRTAERYAYYLLRAPSQKSDSLAAALQDLQAGIAQCPKTFMLMDAGREFSELYTDSKRDKQLVAVVEEPFDVIALEKIGQFKGTYHVLGGAISPIDGIGPENLHINELLGRINDDDIKEIILATNASVEGESTALYIQKMIHEQYPDVKVTRLARGLPVGTDLEYADQITLAHALEGRTQL